MERKKNCKIVQDLLPNYIEKLTSKETNQFIEEHLSNCNDCKEILENMKEDPLNNNQNIEHKKVKYLRKYNRKLRVFEISSIILLLIILGISIFYWKYYRDGYFSVADTLIDVTSTCPDVFYATIEEIETEEPKGELQGSKTLKVKGTTLNDERYKGEFYVNIPLDNINDNVKIEHNGNTADIDQLQANQIVAVYVYDDGNSDNYLGNVRKIVILDK